MSEIAVVNHLDLKAIISLRYYSTSSNEPPYKLRTPSSEPAADDGEVYQETTFDQNLVKVHEVTS